MVPGPAVLAFVTLAAFTAGVVDAIAGGGGLITLPVLIAAGLPTQLAISTNKGQAVFGASSSAVAFWRRGGVDRKRAPLAFAFGFLGSAAGALLLLEIDPRPLRPIVACLLVFAAAVVLLRGYVEPRARVVEHWRVAVVLIAFALGAYDGFFGPGVGSLLIVAFAMTFGDSLTRASGNAKVVNLASNLAAFLVFAARGAIAWRIALPMAAANVVGAAVGARLALAKGDRLVRAVVLVVVAAVVVKLVVDMVRGA